MTSALFLGASRQDSATSPWLDAAFAKGLSLDMLVRTDGNAGKRLHIANIVAESGETIELHTGNSGGDLVLESTGKRIVAAGALPPDHWVRVRVQIAKDGQATLSISGLPIVSGQLRLPAANTRARVLLGPPADKDGGRFTGMLANVQIWQTTKLGYVDVPTPKAAGLWAFYPCASLAGGKLEDLGGFGRHAALAGAAELRSVDWSVVKAPVKVASLKQLPLQLAPLTGMSGQLGLQAWLRPQQLDGTPLFDVGDGKRRLRVRADAAGIVSLSFDEGDASKVLCSSATPIQKGEWTHLGVTIDAGNVARIYLRGQVVAAIGLEDTKLGKKQKQAVLELLRKPLLRCYVGAGQGSLAEVRVWTAVPSAAKLAAGWARRLIGDEPGLALYYRLDGKIDALLQDSAPSRAHVSVPGLTKLALVDDTRVPLYPSHRQDTPAVATRGKLLREWLPRSLFPKTKIAGFGKLDGDRINARIFEATLEPSSPTNEPTPGQRLLVRVDRPMLAVAVDDDGAESRLAAWRPGITYDIAVPSSGRVRMRFIAGELDCPAIRVALPEIPGLWWTAEPARDAHQKLASASADELAKPGDGRPSPLPADTSSEDRQAAAATLTGLASVSARPQTSGARQPTARGGIGSIFGGIAKVGKDIGDAFEDATEVVAKITKQGLTAPAKLVVSASADLDKLIDKAAKVAAHVGRDAIRGWLGGATSLAVVASSEFVGAVQIVGEAVVKGSKRAFRVLVATAEDAMAAVGAFLERIGAAIMDFIEYLATLLSWDRFLTASDAIYADAESVLTSVRETVDQLPAARKSIRSDLVELGNSKFADKTIGELIGVDGKNMPVIDEFEYVIDKVSSLFSSSKREQTKPSRQVSAPAPSSTIAADAELPSGPFEAGLAGVLNAPIKPLLQLPLMLWDTIDPVLDVVFGAIDGTVDVMDEFLRARIKVPWLTKMIEDVILGGRTLNVLRIISLIGAIPWVLVDTVIELVGGRPKQEQSAAKTTAAASTSSKTRAKTRAKTTRASSTGTEAPATSDSTTTTSGSKSGPRTGDKARKWTIFSVSVINGLIAVIVATKEYQKSTTPSPTDAQTAGFNTFLGSFKIIAGALTALSAAMNFWEVKHIQGTAKVFFLISTIIDTINAIWMVVLGTAMVAASAKLAKLERLDPWFDFGLGSILMISATTGMIMQAVELSGIGNIVFRVASWTARGLAGNFEGQLKPWTPKAVAACWLLAASADLGDALLNATTTVA